jgi:hypothetical protein
VEHRLSRVGLPNDELDRLQALHESAVECLDGRQDELTRGMRALTVLFAFVGDVENGGFDLSTVR